LGAALTLSFPGTNMNARATMRTATPRAAFAGGSQMARPLSRALRRRGELTDGLTGRLTAARLDAGRRIAADPPDAADDGT
jgi:hypothetical protein